jgi:vitamin B12 transporter
VPRFFFLWAILIAAGLQCSGQTSTPVSPQTSNTPASSSAPFPAQDLVVTVSSEAIPVSASAASVTVVSAEQIRQSGTRDVSDILRQVPFLHMQRAGGQGGLTTVFIRGAKENLVMVMIDGVPVNDVTNNLGGAFDFSTLSIDNIERIEIVRGPLSSLYGSEAIAGVINIISRQNENTPSVAINAEGGNFATAEFGTSIVGRFKRFDYALSDSYQTVGEQIGLDSYSLGTVALSSTANLGNNRFLQLNARYDNREAAGFAEGSGGPEFALLREAQNTHAVELVGGASYQQQAKAWWLYGITFDGFHRTDHGFTPAIWDQIPPTNFSLPSTLGDTDFLRLHLGEFNNFRIYSGLTAHLGINWREERGSNHSVIAGTTPFSYDLSRDTLDVNSELIYAARRLTASVGLGINKTGGYAAVFSPRVGVNYLLTPRTHLKGTWGEGFFIPSFYALSAPVIGNPDLQPEHSQSLDLGVEHAFARPRLQASATYFHNSMRDLVDFDSTTFQLVNRDNVVTQGVEFGSTYDIASTLQLGSSASWLQWSLENTTQPLRYLPHWRGGADLDWSISRRLHFRGEALVVGRRFDFQVPVPEITTVGAYSTLNLIVNYEVRDGLTTYVRAENLLNSNYHEYIGFPNPGIYVRAGVTYRFKLAPSLGRKGN